MESYRELFMQITQRMALLLNELKKAQGQWIERVVCSGGGAKGIVYPGAYKAMEESGILKGVREVSGASAGAITAAFMAVGMPSQGLRDTLLSMNLKTLLGHGVGALFGKNAPGICFMTKDGNPLEAFIRQHINDALRDTLEKMEDADAIANQHADFKKILTKLHENEPRVSFGDLAVLNQLFPDKFKRLVIPALKFPNGEIQIFNSSLTPDVEIALACRASASIPAILKPVEIEIGGVKQKFIDGGVYDNLPTDYFDTDVMGLFTKNQKPERTLIFAFGEGLKDKDNHVFQALYGARWDEVVSDALFEKIIDVAIKSAKKYRPHNAELNTQEYQATSLIHAVKLVLRHQVKHFKMPKREAEAIRDAVKKSMNILLANQYYNKKQSKVFLLESNVEEMSHFIKNQMKPRLYNAGILLKFETNVLLESLGDLNMPYKNSDRCEEGYQKLRSEYALRTVELRVGNIKTLDFDAATKYARIMDSFGYLDTINYISNHELYDKNKFNVEQFYGELVNYFELIYKSVLQGAGKDPGEDALLKEISHLRTHLETLGKSDAVINQQLYQFIKPRAEGKLDSLETFALSRAVEFHNQTLRADDLFKEAYEQGFKRRSPISVSTMSGERVIRMSALHDSLTDKNMFELFMDKISHSDKSRSDKMFGELLKIEKFDEAFEQCIENKVKLS